MKTLEHTVMARVQRIYYMRKLIGPTAMKAYSLVVLSLALLSVVSVANIYANMPSIMSPAALFQFMTSALVQTELLVKMLLLGLAVVVVLFVRDFLRTMRPADSHGYLHA